MLDNRERLVEQELEDARMLSNEAVCLKIADDGHLILEHGTNATAVWTPLLAYEFMALENVTSA